MKQADRERMAAALLRGVSLKKWEIYKVLEELAVKDIDALEPIVDDIVKRERAAVVEEVKATR